MASLAPALSAWEHPLFSGLRVRSKLILIRSAGVVLTSSAGPEAHAASPEQT
jgi:hypothetical protein